MLTNKYRGTVDLISNIHANTTYITSIDGLPYIIYTAWLDLCLHDWDWVLVDLVNVEGAIMILCNHFLIILE